MTTISKQQWNRYRKVEVYLFIIENYDNLYERFEYEHLEETEV